MSEGQIVDELLLTAEDLADRANQIVKRMSTQRLRVKHQNKTLMEIPLVAGVAGALLSPGLAALAIFSAILTKCTISVEDTEK
jgi:hypothetical protein